MSSQSLEAALSYAERGWPVVPFADRGGRKYPLSEHGKNDASREPRQIKEWFYRWSDALFAVVTGRVSGIAALDVDVRAQGSGVDTLDSLGIVTHPHTPTAHTPSGGYHILFAHPGFHVPCSASKLGPYLDVRGDDGCLILPPGPGRFWDSQLGPDTPLAPTPEWVLDYREPATPSLTPSRPRHRRPLDPYAEAALDGAVRQIADARAGEQHVTLNRECFAIGGLVASGAIPLRLAVDALEWAAARMPSYDRHRPWCASELKRQVSAAFRDGLATPREIISRR